MLTLAPRGMGLDPGRGRIHGAPGTYRALFLGSFAIGTMAIVLGLTVRAPGFVGGRPNRAVGG